MCFAGRHGMVGVKVNYRPPPANPWRHQGCRRSLDIVFGSSLAPLFESAAGRTGAQGVGGL